MREFMAVAKALADENRVRLLRALEGRELCVCQLVEFAGLAPSTVSKHLSILRQARLVDARKEGRWIYYRQADGDAPAAVLGALTWVRDSLAEAPGANEDEERIKEVLRMDLEELCRRQSCR